VRNGNFAADGRDIHDSPMAERLHVRYYSVDQRKWSPKVSRHRLLVIAERHVFHRTDLNDAGIIDEDVDMADLFNDGCHCLAHLNRICDVTGVSESPRTVRLELTRGLTKFLGITRYEH